MKHKIEWSYSTKIIAIILSAFIGGGVVGFIIGRVTASVDDEPTESIVETTPPESSEPDVITVTSSEPEKVYYDCPLDYSLQNYIRGLCERNGIPMSLVIAMIEVESSFQPDAVSGTDDYGLMQINGIGEVIANSVVQYFANPDNRAFVERLRGYGLQMEIGEQQRQAQSDKLNGQSVVISGVFQHHSRDEYKALIEQNGGKNVGSISNKTSFILAGDNMGPAKLEKAQKLGIRIMSEDEFLSLIQT